MGNFETISSGDTTTRQYEAGDIQPGSPGVVVLHPWWGLNDDILAYSDRLGDAGFAVVAPDLFGGQVATTVEDAERLAGAADEAAIDAIVVATVDRLVGAPRSDVEARSARFLLRRPLGHVESGRAGPGRRHRPVLRHDRRTGPDGRLDPRPGALCRRRSV